jgi:predicted transcriptional regulator
MKYKNTKTGAIIDSPCIISGGDWINLEEEVKEIEEFEKVGMIVEKIAEVAKMVEETKVEEEEEIEGIEGITVKEIKQELDAFGIKYNPRAKKQELYDLMIKGR